MQPPTSIHSSAGTGPAGTGPTGPDPAGSSSAGASSAGCAAAAFFSVDPVSGLLRGAAQVLSPHYDARPAGAGLDLIVVHGISLPPGEFGGPWIDRLFSGDLAAAVQAGLGVEAGGRVSAHALIRRDGSVHQYVPFGARAWHAGRSSYAGRNACNDFSIGIELEGSDDRAYEDVQYEVLAALITALCVAYPSLHHDRVVGHADIAPGRKTDPGPGFDWRRLRALLQR